MADVTEIGRRVYAQSAKDENPEGIAKDALEGRDLDEFDTVGFASMVGLAWGIALSDNPFIAPDELREAAAEAAKLAFQAAYTCGGWEAMQAGARAEKAVA